MNATPERFASRGGEKLAAALDGFGLSIAGLACADLGSHAGGFVDCLLQRGAAKVFSVDTAYGLLAWKLRRDRRVILFERTNALHVELPESVDLVTIDVGWTRQAAILPRARLLLREPASCDSATPPWVVTLIKPQYEAAPEELRQGVLPEDQVAPVVDSVLSRVASLHWDVVAQVDSPLRGHGGNREVFALLRPRGERGG